MRGPPFSVGLGGLMSGTRRNPRLLCVFRALQMSLFPMAVITVFFKADIGMTMGQIFHMPAKAECAVLAVLN